MHNILPEYQGHEWLEATLPSQAEGWLDGSKHGMRKRGSGARKARQALGAYASDNSWRWPDREIIFISDLHADADALLASLVASGGLAKTGPNDEDMCLTERGKAARFVFGGDFFDKGPSNLRLLQVLRLFLQTGADAVLLAGNHDLRVLYGMRCAGQADKPRDGHFFARMSNKGIPFLVEIHDRYHHDSTYMAQVPDLDTCRRLLLPGKAWYRGFPLEAAGYINQQAIDRELKKVRKKAERFEAACLKAGLDLRQAFAAAQRWRQLFLDYDGDYAWFYPRLQLAHREASFLFVHAGIDNQTALAIRERGCAALNRQFSDQLHGSPFDFYFSPIANTIRTKYRVVDGQLTRFGSAIAKRAGISAIVHGHRNMHKGQRLALRKGLLHIEGDITLDQSSRHKEGLSGTGAGATIIHPSGHIVGISTDYPTIKVFEPERLNQAIIIPLAS